MKPVILAETLDTEIGEKTTIRHKPMIAIGGMPGSKARSCCNLIG